MDDAHEMLRRHWKLTGIERAQPLGAELVTVLRDLHHPRTHLRALQRVRKSGKPPDCNGRAFVCGNEGRLCNRVHRLRECCAGWDLWLDWRPVRLAEGDEQLLTVLEVAVDGAGRHAGPTRDLLERGPLVAFLADECARGLEQCGSCSFPLVAFGLPAGRPFFFGCHCQ